MGSPGAGGDWRAQLEAQIREQPVFALLPARGMAAVHDFCEREEVPACFPSTLLPAASGAYTIYFNSGLAGEAEALASYLSRPPGSSRSIGTRTRGSPWQKPSERALGDRVVDFRWGAKEPLPKADDLVLWLEGKDAVALGELAGFRRIYLSASLVDPDPPACPAREARLHLSLRLPGREGPHVYRARAWLRSRGIERTHERQQLNAFYTLSLAEHALDHMAGSFSRDFFVESVEREAEVELNPGVFPRLSLGPGQRFASKGCYIVRLGESGIEPLSDWIVTE